jgi:hypothetical protein
VDNTGEQMTWFPNLDENDKHRRLCREEGDIGGKSGDWARLSGYSLPTVTVCRPIRHPTLPEPSTAMPETK